MVSLAIAGGLVVVGVPALSSVMRTVQLKTATNGLFSSLVLARSEAIKRNARVVVCKSADGQACAKQGSWEQGWLVFHDANNNAQRDANELLVFQQAALDADIKLFGNSHVEHYVSYTALGSTELASGAFQAGTFTVCRVTAEPTEVRTVVVNAVGRPRTSKAQRPHCR